MDLHLFLVSLPFKVPCVGFDETCNAAVVAGQPTRERESSIAAPHLAAASTKPCDAHWCPLPPATWPSLLISNSCDVL